MSRREFYTALYLQDLNTVASPEFRLTEGTSSFFANSHQRFYRELKQVSREKQIILGELLSKMVKIFKKSTYGKMFLQLRTIL